MHFSVSFLCFETKGENCILQSNLKKKKCNSETTSSEVHGCQRSTIVSICRNKSLFDIVSGATWTYWDVLILKQAFWEREREIGSWICMNVFKWEKTFLSLQLEVKQRMWSGIFLTWYQCRSNLTSKYPPRRRQIFKKEVFFFLLFFQQPVQISLYDQQTAAGLWWQSWFMVSIIFLAL